MYEFALIFLVVTLAVIGLPIVLVLFILLGELVGIISDYVITCVFGENI